MRLAVLGASGMLGTQVTALFRAAGHELLEPSLEVLDLSRPGTLDRYFSERSFDGTVNCAAMTAVDDCEDPAFYPAALAVNGTGVGHLARLSRSTGRWMIHVSTDYVFDGKGTRPYRETDPVNPVNAYGRTKLEGERAFLESGARGWLVRTSWLYGPNGRNFVRTMAGLLRTMPKVEVVDDQVGGPTNSRDLAGFFLDLVSSNAPEGLYHFANDGYVSWHGLALGVRDALGLTGPIVEPVPSSRFPRPAPRPLNSRFDLSKARSVVRAPIRPWKDALVEYLKEDRL